MDSSSQREGSSSTTSTRRELPSGRVSWARELGAGVVVVMRRLCARFLRGTCVPGRKWLGIAQPAHSRVDDTQSGWAGAGRPPGGGGGGGGGQPADLSLFRRALVPTELPAPTGALDTGWRP